MLRLVREGRFHDLQPADQGSTSLVIPWLRIPAAVSTLLVLPVKPILPNLTLVPIVSRLQNWSTGIGSTSLPKTPRSPQLPG